MLLKLLYDTFGDVFSTDVMSCRWLIREMKCNMGVLGTRTIWFVISHLWSSVPSASGLWCFMKPNPLGGLLSTGADQRVHKVRRQPWQWMNNAWTNLCCTKINNGRRYHRNEGFHVLLYCKATGFWQRYISCNFYLRVPILGTHTWLLLQNDLHVKIPLFTDSHILLVM